MTLGALDCVIDEGGVAVATDGLVHPTACNANGHRARLPIAVLDQSGDMTPWMLGVRTEFRIDVGLCSVGTFTWHLPVAHAISRSGPKLCASLVATHPVIKRAARVRGVVTSRHGWSIQFCHADTNPFSTYTYCRLDVEIS